jgi:hypothetical protein
MPRAKKPPQKVLDNVDHEALAQELADGATQWNAYLAVKSPELDGPEDRKAHFKRIAEKDRHALRTKAGNLCRHPDIRQRVVTILAERHDKRMAIKMKDIKVSSDFVTDRLVTLVDRCMQAIPVVNGQNDAIGTWRFEPNGAVKALELLGLEQGMFERKHKHLHAKQNPLEGNRDEIVGRLGVLLDQLSDGDLRSIGLKRLSVVEVRVERVDGVGGKQVKAVPALPEAS